VVYLWKISGWWLSHPSEKYEFVNGRMTSHILWKIKNVPNHQPDINGKIIELNGIKEYK